MKNIKQSKAIYRWNRHKDSQYLKRIKEKEIKLRNDPVFKRAKNDLKKLSPISKGYKSYEELVRVSGKERESLFKLCHIENKNRILRAVFEEAWINFCDNYGIDLLELIIHNKVKLVPFISVGTRRERHPYIPIKFIDKPYLEINSKAATEKDIIDWVRILLTNREGVYGDPPRLGRGKKLKVSPLEIKRRYLYLKKLNGKQVAIQMLSKEQKCSQSYIERIASSKYPSVVSRKSS